MFKLTCRYFKLKYLSRCMSSIPKSAPLNYKIGDKPTNEILDKINLIKTNTVIIPHIINGNYLYNTPSAEQLCPYDNSVVAKYHRFESKLNPLIDSEANKFKHSNQWNICKQEERNNIILKASELIDKKYRPDLMAATIVGQGKTAYEADIDINELVDFLRFNVYYIENIVKRQPESYPDEYNIMEYNPHPGFVASITPFNFTAIGGHLVTAPLLCGNNVIWKPSDNAILSNYYVCKALYEAGVPQENLTFILSEPEVFANAVLSQPNMSAVAFTGSSNILRKIIHQIGLNINAYDTFPKVIGEGGGKNFHLALPDSDPDFVAKETIQSAFGYSGQKCSACSRFYIPKSREHEFIDALVEHTKKIVVGSPEEEGTFMSALISNSATNRINNFVEKHIINYKIFNHKILYNVNKNNQYFYPLIIKSYSSNSIFMRDELFAPILTIYVYNDTNYTELAQMIGLTTKYGLTGSIFTNDEHIKNELILAFRNYTGNFYINTKSTGSMVGRQPFGGGRASGTNDKAGSEYFLHRFINHRSLKFNIKNN